MQLDVERVLKHAIPQQNVNTTLAAAWVVPISMTLLIVGRLSVSLCRVKLNTVPNLKT